MDKSAIRNFAIEARKILMKSAETEAGFYGVTKNGCKSPIQKGDDFEVYETIAGTENRIYGADVKRRANLVKAVETLGFEQVIEETAYTWFNRIIAIRFMEVNDYLPTRVKVLSSETGSSTPDIVTQSLDVDLNMTPEELEKVQKAKDENRYDDAFRMLFIKQCNELNAILPGLFEKTDDYMELLLKLSYTSDGVVRMLVDSIDENNFNVETEGQVEIIGWMYQYYNTELKAEVFGRPSGVKIRKEDIPAATQLFTPDWIVRYMVENSVGRVWIEHLRALDATLNEQGKAEEYGWKYYLPEAEQEYSVAEKLDEIRKSYAELEPKDLTCIDPCMGSGHILVYMFDVLIDIYRSEGFSEKDAVFSILENNIRGLDIDKRAYQLSYFALMMKARGYNRTFFRGKQDEEGNRRFVEPMVLAIEESNTVNLGQLKYFGANLNEIEKNNAINQMQGLLESLRDAKEYGSILTVDSYDWELLLEFIDSKNTDGQISFDTLGIELTQGQMKRLIYQGKIMSNKYCVVSTNPPYMGLANGNAKLNEFVKKNYPDSKVDLFAVFIERCKDMTQSMGYQAMITQQAWMFTAIYEQLRKKISTANVINLIHLGARGFDEINGEVVQTVSFVIANVNVDNYLGSYLKLTEGSSETEKEKMFFERNNFYKAKYEEFEQVPYASIAYWLSHNALLCFGKEKLSQSATTREGMTTADNERFLRYWSEVDWHKVSTDSISIEAAENSRCKWFPYNKGGTNRKWYGNNELVVNWEQDGFEIRNIKDERTGRIRSHNYNAEYSFRECGTWTAICSGDIMVRFSPAGALFDSKGASVFASTREELLYILGMLNSKVSGVFLKVLSPAYEFKVGHVANVPLLFGMKNEVIELVERAIALSQQDWDSYETSWNFSKHPLFPKEHDDNKLEECYREWVKGINSRFAEMKHIEERLNDIFIRRYGLEGELVAELDDKAITVSRADIKRDIKSLISYAVGCMLGRYSIDKDGIAYAGGEWEISSYGRFTPDEDNCILISDEDYIDDDIVGLFCKWLKIVYGEKYLEDNLAFIANAIGGKGNSSRECVRNYFLNEFVKDHIKIYQKHPIYWLFDSGKNNGFKCLIYMHRYNKDTLKLIRSEYLHKTQDAVKNALKNAEYIIRSSASVVERAKATKDRDKYVKQLNEMRIYYQALSHLALQKIEIDLDDGVKHNYQLFQGIEVIADGGKKQKVNLLAKI